MAAPCFCCQSRATGSPVVVSYRADLAMLHEHLLEGPRGVGHGGAAPRAEADRQRKVTFPRRQLRPGDVVVNQRSVARYRWNEPLVKLRKRSLDVPEPGIRWEPGP